MKKSRYISFLLAAVILLSGLVFPLETSAAVDISSLNSVRQYYVRTIGSLARADYYENNILASITVSQAIFEAGWGMYTLPVAANNLFGMKAFSTTKEKVYDLSGRTLYNTYEDMMLVKGHSYEENKASTWQAFDGWGDSVDAHSALLNRYANVPGETDYKKAAEAIVAGGYCSDAGYVDMVVKFIEDYGLAEYDDLTPDEDGIVAITADEERVNLEIGDTHTVALNYFPSDKTPSSISWKSDDPSVATVDSEGNVKAVAHGTTLITATLANGREACCIVYVDCNATVINSDINVRSSASTSAGTNGRFSSGSAIKVTSDKIYTDSASGTDFYAVKGYNTAGKLVTGYAATEYIFLHNRVVKDIVVLKNNLTLKTGTTHTVLTAIAGADADDTSLSWKSDNSAVATVSDGVITAKSSGTAKITVSAIGGASETITVTVASSVKNYKGIVTSSTLNIRNSASTSSSRIGSFSHLTEVTVLGEPTGAWYKVSGKNTSGTTVSGYVYAPYVQIVESSISYATAEEDVTVYFDKDTDSVNYGTLALDEKYAILSEDDNGWFFVAGKNSSGKAVYGYAKLDESTSDGNGDESSSDTSVPDESSDDSSEDDTSSGSVTVIEGYYGRVTDEIYVREGAGATYNTISRFSAGTQLVITGEENGWYKVIGKDINGTEVSGYSSATYIKVLYTGVTTSNLNVRSQPSTSGTALGILSNGATVTIVGEKDASGWYYVEGTDQSGNAVSGYCSGNYITVNGKITVTIEIEDDNNNNNNNNESDTPVVEGTFVINDTRLSIVDGYLYGVPTNMKVYKLKECFDDVVRVQDNKSNSLTWEYVVGTGYRVKASDDTRITVVISGDVDGDGDITQYDYILVKRAFFNTYTLSGAYLKAALVSGGDELSVVDYVLIKRAYFGTYSFE